MGKIGVFVNAVEIGKIHFDKNGGGNFFFILNEYIPNQIRENYQDLISMGGREFPNLPPVFENLLPEGIRLEILKRKVANGDNRLNILQYCCDSDISFGGHLAKSGYTSKSFPNVRPEDVLEVDTDILDSDFFHSLKRSDDVLSGPSGVQDKIYVNITQTACMKQKAMDPNSCNAILKKPMEEFRHGKHDEKKINIDYFSENEHLIMNILSRYCEVPTARTSLIRINGKVHIAVERFDVSTSGRRPFVELSTLLDLTSEEKYNAKIIDMCKVINKYAGADGLRVFILAFLNGLIFGNADMHPKNFSLHRGGPGELWRLTNFYDMINLTPYGFKTFCLPVGSGRPTMFGAGLRKMLEELHRVMLESSITIDENTLITNAIDGFDEMANLIIPDGKFVGLMRAGIVDRSATIKENLHEINKDVFRNKQRNGMFIM